MCVCVPGGDVLYSFLWSCAGQRSVVDSVSCCTCISYVCHLVFYLHCFDLMKIHNGVNMGVRISSKLYFFFLHVQTDGLLHAGASLDPDTLIIEQHMKDASFVKLLLANQQVTLLLSLTSAFNLLYLLACIHLLFTLIHFVPSYSFCLLAFVFFVLCFFLSSSLL